MGRARGITTTAWAGREVLQIYYYIQYNTTAWAGREVLRILFLHIYNTTLGPAERYCLIFPQDFLYTVSLYRKYSTYLVSLYNKFSSKFSSKYMVRLYSK